MNRDFQNTQRRLPSPSTDRVPQSSRAITVNPNDETFLAQLAAVSDLLQLPADESSFHASDPPTQNYTQQQFPSSSSSHLYEHPIPDPSSQPTFSSFSSASQWPQSVQDLFNSMLLSSATGSGPATSAMSSPAASSSTGIATEPEILDEGRTTAEEKRRRNTVASARFRIKKKQRTTNLERSVSDLTSRLDELEQEVAVLRQENNWLKEIVLLKGTRLAALNLTQHLPSMNQSPKNGSGHSLDSDVESEGEKEDLVEAVNKTKKGKSKA